MQFRRTRRRFGCEGNPTELVHWSQCFTVVRKHGDHSLPGEILAVRGWSFITCGGGGGGGRRQFCWGGVTFQKLVACGGPECHVLPSFSWFGFELLCEVVAYVAVVFCTCLWLTWFDALQYTNLYWSSARARMGSSWIYLVRLPWLASSLNSIFTAWETTESI